MIQRIRKLPSPALAISVIALILAVGGGTFAIASNDNKQDRRIAKKVANKQITKRAPKLFVKHAKSANSASSASNADSLGGVAASGYQGRTMWALISADGTSVAAQSGGISIQSHFPGGYYLHFPQEVAGKALLLTPSEAAGSPGGTVDAKGSPCGGEAAPDTVECFAGTNTTSDVFVATFSGGSQANVAFYITIVP